MSDNYFPLPWREGMKRRGITPTFILPRSRDELGIFDKGEEFNCRVASLGGFNKLVRA